MKQRQQWQTSGLSLNMTLSCFVAAVAFAVTIYKFNQHVFVIKVTICFSFLLTRILCISMTIMCLWHHTILFTDSFSFKHRNMKETFSACMHNNFLFFGSIWSCSSVSSSSSSHAESACYFTLAVTASTLHTHRSLHTDVTCLPTKESLKTGRKTLTNEQTGARVWSHRWWETSSQRWYEEARWWQLSPASLYADSSRVITVATCWCTCAMIAVEETINTCESGINL